MLAGWKRLSFIANDLFIDETRGFCKKHVDTKIIGEYICTPIGSIFPSCKWSKL